MKKYILFSILMFAIITLSAQTTYFVSASNGKTLLEEVVLLK